MTKDIAVQTKGEIMARVSGWLDENAGNYDEISINVKAKDVDKDELSMKFKAIIKKE